MAGYLMTPSLKMLSQGGWEARGNFYSSNHNNNVISVAQHDTATQSVGQISLISLGQSTLAYVKPIAKL